MHIQHAVAWVDHREARIFLLDREGFERATVSTELPHHQTHNKAGTIDGKRIVPRPIILPGDRHRARACSGVVDRRPELGSRRVGKPHPIP